METDPHDVMRYFATGVCVLSTYLGGSDDRRHDAQTINSLTSVSLDPPLVAVCLRTESSFLVELLATKAWAISILDISADDIARALAQDKETRTAALRTIAASPGARTGALILDSLGWLECGLRAHFDVGDHTLLVGEVLATGTAQRRPPLICLRGRHQVLGEGRSPAADGESNMAAVVN